MGLIETALLRNDRRLGGWIERSITQPIGDKNDCILQPALRINDDLPGKNRSRMLLGAAWISRHPDRLRRGHNTRERNCAFYYGCTGAGCRRREISCLHYSLAGNANNQCQKACKNKVFCFHTAPRGRVVPSQFFFANKVAAPIWFGARGCRALLGLLETRCILARSRP